MDRYDEAKEWMMYADNDFEAANQLASFHFPKIEIICYHCQQSAEKILKAFLVCSDKNPPKVHDLEELRGLCENIDNTFIELKKESIRLNDYSSQPRYPFGLEISEADMRLAIKDSERIREFVRTKILK
jgi:HEPN domain-containing protein